MIEQELAIAVHPGEILREELDERGGVKIEFAEIIGRSCQLVNEIVTGKEVLQQIPLRL